MILSLILRLANRAMARGRYMTIMSRDGSRPYLTRIFLVGSEHACGWRICIHLMHISDEGGPHDHRWPFVSMVIRGRFFECMKHRAVWRKPWSVYMRGMRTFHRVELPPGHTAATLVLMLPRYRADWGFLWLGRWWPHARYLNTFFGRNIA